MKSALVVFFASCFASHAVADSVVATRNIPANSIIGSDDIRLATAEVNGGIRSLGDARGQETRRFIYAGRPVMTRDVGPPTLIDRNQTVKLVYKVGTLTIATDGRSLDRAGVGDLVRVLNLSSRTTVSGTVTRDGTVVVSNAITSLQ